MGKKIIYDQKTENDVIAYYQAGYSLKDCGEKFFNNKSNYRIVRRILVKNKIHLRTFEESKDRHYENARKTVKVKYNVDNISQLVETKQKVKDTCLKKYGVDNPGKIQIGKEKAKQTCLKKYGETHFTKTDT